jgi:hypothetical protein
MLQWGSLHPYNAAHAYQIQGPLRDGRLRQSLREAMEFNGLGAVGIADDGRTYAHHADSTPPDLEVLRGEGDLDAQLALHLGDRLNEPFPLTDHAPRPDERGRELSPVRLLARGRR